MVIFILKEGVKMLANRLKILLAERDLSIKDVIEDTGISRNVLSNMINKPFANISTENIDKLCNYLEVTPAIFFDYSKWRFSYELKSNVKISDTDVKATAKQVEAVLEITMRSGKRRYAFELYYVIEYDMDYGAGDNYDVFITVYDPMGADNDFIKVYHELSPLFQHQIEAEITQPIPVIMEKAKRRGEFDNKKDKIKLQFDYVDFNNDIVFQYDFIYKKS
ncbi:helix-turn-helix domain-containing protein [Limosilactobacillus reuteri]|uniref:helix-turn-helix domain-containing protein n=2 Tax=Limosilactobacillus reuteri TaxID=1598 RepID=UPI001E3F6920|nr:helix-turn-helix transcriptional regulator [Limosilactobacillus reuteri]MCC4444250.1 helix-turn-helix transcriptional regulator [Limosilactobacillus reuteri]